MGPLIWLYVKRKNLEKKRRKKIPQKLKFFPPDQQYLNHI